MWHCVKESARASQSAQTLDMYRCGRCTVDTSPSVTERLPSLVANPSFTTEKYEEVATKSRASGLGSTPTNHSICFDSTKPRTEGIRLDQNSDVLPFDCDDPPATAHWVLGCQEVLEDQRQIPSCCSWIAARKSGSWAFLLTGV